MTENNKDIIDGRKEEENKSITLRDIFDFIVFNWYWFALSAIAFATRSKSCSTVSVGFPSESFAR